METDEFEGDETDMRKPEDDSVVPGDDQTNGKEDEEEETMEDEENMDENDGTDKQEDGEKPKVSEWELKQFSVEYREAKTKVVTQANHNKYR